MDSIKPLRIGCASAFWGDTNTAAQQLVSSGALDVLVFDYLAEVTLSIMAGQRLKDPTLGYAKDFVKGTLPPLLQEIATQKIKVISNAGGLNPEACATALHNEIKRQGLPLKIATVSGDNLMPHWRDLKTHSLPFPEDAAEDCPAALITNNAYIGATPIKAALEAGADIIITGRIVDSALVLGPLMHHFQWTTDDYDRLAQGCLAGHVIECGTQCTGGNFTDWHRISDWTNLGFPIVICQENGTFTVTKPEGTGGLVDRHTVAEQITYEIGDPNHYYLPDVICDFSAITLTTTGADQVTVQGAKGRAPSPYLKFIAIYMDGFRCTAYCVLAGPNAVHKANITANALLTKINKGLISQGKKPIELVDIELLGAEAQYGARALRQDTREVVMKFACQHADKKALVYFSQEIAQASTGMTPGFTTLLGGRPTVYPVARLYSGLIPKKFIHTKISFKDSTEAALESAKSDLIISEIESEIANFRAPPCKAYARLKLFDWPTPDNRKTRPILNQPPLTTVPLGLLALTRSGDKGNHANIGVIARNGTFLCKIKKALSPEALALYFAHLFDPELGEILCYDWPGLNAINIVLKHCLGNGGIASLRSDPQGKALGQQLLDFPIPLTDDLATQLPADRRPPYVQHD
jgi:hypothetical protein